MWVIAILAIAALLTSMLSAIIGMGGGIMLLAVMFCFLDHSETIASHASVQLASNGTRILVYLRDVDWRTLGRYCLGMVPGMVIGGLVLWRIGQVGPETEPYFKIVVGIYVLIATYLPKPKKEIHHSTWWDFPGIGLVAGVSALTIGAIGPLIAPIFARREFVKERLIATKATCQMATHFAKLPTLLLVSKMQVANLGAITLVMIAMVIPGTLMGKRVQKHVTPERFKFLFKAALTLAGLKVLIYDGLYMLVSGPASATSAEISL